MTLEAAGPACFTGSPERAAELAKARKAGGACVASVAKAAAAAVEPVIATPKVAASATSGWPRSVGLRPTSIAPPSAPRLQRTAGAIDGNALPH